MQVENIVVAPEPIFDPVFREDVRLERAILKRPARVTVPFIALNRHSSVTLDQQIRGSLQHIIGCGLIPGASRLPSSRTLASALGVSRNIVVSAYEMLVSEGALAARVGSGTSVSGSVATAVFRDPDGVSLSVTGV